MKKPEIRRPVFLILTIILAIIIVALLFAPASKPPPVQKVATTVSLDATTGAMRAWLEKEHSLVNISSVDCGIQPPLSKEAGHTYCSAQGSEIENGKLVESVLFARCPTGKDVAPTATCD